MFHFQQQGTKAHWFNWFLEMRQQKNKEKSMNLINNSLFPSSLGVTGIFLRPVCLASTVYNWVDQQERERDKRDTHT